MGFLVIHLQAKRLIRRKLVEKLIGFYRQPLGIVHLPPLVVAERGPLPALRVKHIECVGLVLRFSESVFSELSQKIPGLLEMRGIAVVEHILP